MSQHCKTYTSSLPHQHRRREITKLRNTNSIFNLSKERTRTNTYIYIHTQDTYKGGGYIYIGEERNIYQVGLVVSKPIST